jgi:L-iditol 2-dehydrogenase
MSQLAAAPARQIAARRCAATTLVCLEGIVPNALKVVIEGPWQSRLVEVDVPEPMADWALVKVHVAPMCTEYKAFLAGTSSAYLGHEAAGEVVAVGPAARVSVGDRVVAMPLSGCGHCALCSAGDYIHCEQRPDVQQIYGTREGAATYAQYLLKQDFLLMPIPDGVSYEHASMACCGIGPSFGAFSLMGVSAFDTVLVTGLGPVGLGAVVNARFRGARVIAVDGVRYRAEKARELGAEVVLDPREDGLAGRIRSLTSGLGADRAVDCSGVVAAQRLCIDATRRKGKVAFVGECNDDLPIRISSDMLRKGLTLIGSWHYNLNVYPDVLQVIQRSPDIDKLISHVLPMSRVQEAFETSASHETCKILLKPWE